MITRKALLLTLVLAGLSSSAIYAGMVQCHTIIPNCPSTGGCGFNAIIVACADQGSSNYDGGVNSAGAYKNPVKCGKTSLFGVACGACPVVVAKDPADTCCPPTP